MKYTPEQILNNPFLNKGTAFTQEERNQYGLNGLLPPAVQTLDQQVKQAYAQLQTKPTDLAKRQFLMTLFNENHVLFYKLFSEHINEFMPIVTIRLLPTRLKTTVRFLLIHKMPRIFQSMIRTISKAH